jgi:putative oxidoreductase
LQRLFSTFANGWPGRGLFLQRLLTAAILFHYAIAHLGETVPVASTVSEVIAAGAGILLLLGLWTPVAGTVVAIAEAPIAISHPGDPWTWLMPAALGATLAMIGPGAWSIDARLFGRKQIDISRPSP